MIIEAKLRDGIIFGDVSHSEYVYMPASEMGMEAPMCIYEERERHTDVDMAGALRLIRVRSLRPVNHPLLGKSSC